jgi:hypothetical protein
MGVDMSSASSASGLEPNVAAAVVVSDDALVGEVGKENNASGTSSSDNHADPDRYVSGTVLGDPLAPPPPPPLPPPSEAPPVWLDYIDDASGLCDPPVSSIPADVAGVDAASAALEVNPSRAASTELREIASKRSGSNRVKVKPPRVPRPKVNICSSISERLRVGELLKKFKEGPVH